MSAGQLKLRDGVPVQVAAGARPEAAALPVAGGADPTGTKPASPPNGAPRS